MTSIPIYIRLEIFYGLYQADNPILFLYWRLVNVSAGTKVYVEWFLAVIIRVSRCSTFILISVVLSIEPTFSLEFEQEQLIIHK